MKYKLKQSTEGPKLSISTISTGNWQLSNTQTQTDNSAQLNQCGKKLCPQPQPANWPNTQPRRRKTIRAGQEQEEKRDSFSASRRLNCFHFGPETVDEIVVAPQGVSKQNPQITPCCP